MRKCPRRTFLGSIGAALGAGGIAGVATAATDERADGEASDGSRATTSSEGSDPDALFPYLPASLGDDPVAITAVDPQGMLEANQPREYRLPVRYGDDPEDVEALVSVESNGGDYARHLAALTGSVEPEGEPEEETDDFDRYDLHHGVAAARDDDLLIAEETDVLEAAVDAYDGDEDRLLDETDALADGLAAFEDADSRIVLEANERVAEMLDAEADDVRFLTRAVTVVDPDTMEIDFAVEFSDEDLVTEDRTAAFTETVPTRRSGSEESEVSTDGARIVVSVVRDLEAERKMREHDSPSGLMVRSVDLESEYVEVEVRRGDPTPVDELTLEVAGEEYDREVWAGDAETIQGGDTIRIRTEDVEPNLKVRLVHESEYGTSVSGTRLLSYLRFDFEYDPAGELTIEYDDEIPLDGDEVYVGVVEGERYYHDEEPDRTTQPWAGQEVTAGDAATIDDVDPGVTVVVGYGGASFDDGISHYRIRPPGHVRFDYDAAESTLTATLRVRYEQPASAYELRLDDEPAPTQWSDEYDTIEGEATIELADLEYGTRVEAVWGDDDLWIGSTYVLPSVDLALVEGDDGVALEHVGGDPIPVDDLAVEFWDGESVDGFAADEAVDGTFEEGDRIPLGVDDVEYAYLKYDDYWIGAAIDRSD